MLHTRLQDGTGSGFEAGVSRKAGINGLNVFTTELSDRTSLFQPALNDTFGNQMAIDVSFSGTPDGVYNGGDTTEWTPTVLSGTWDFVSTTNPRSGTKCLDATSTSTGDTALFTRPSTIDLNNFSTMTGWIRIESWGNGTKHVELQARLAGVNKGVVVNIDDFVDTGQLNVYQQYVIPLSTFGIAAETIDEFTMTTIKTSGGNPDYRIDDWQIEETGSPVEFAIEPPLGTTYYMDRIFLNYADVLDTRIANSSIPSLDHNKILGIASLTNGIVFQRVRNRDIIFSATIRNVGDSIKGGAEISSLISDGTNFNTCLTIRVEFLQPVVLNADLQDKIAIIINDDMTGLTSFTAIATGSTEVNFNG